MWRRVAGYAVDRSRFPVVVILSLGDSDRKPQECSKEGQNVIVIHCPGKYLLYPTYGTNDLKARFLEIFLLPLLRPAINSSRYRLSTTIDATCWDYYKWNHYYLVVNSQLNPRQWNLLTTKIEKINIYKSPPFDLNDFLIYSRFFNIFKSRLS